MRFTLKRVIAAGAIGIAAIVTPLSLSVALSGVANTPSSEAGAASFDRILFNQTSGNPADTFVYAPAAGGGPPPQTANISGNCATAAGGVAPILSVCGEVFPSLNYTGTPKAASLGTNGTATGVGAISPAWTIDNKSSGSKQQAEAIDFSPGSDTSDIGTNRVFSDAQIPVQRKDTGVAQNPSVTVQLAEFDSAVPPNLLGTQNCTITGNTGTQITADPDNSAVCAVSTPDPNTANGVPSTFQTLEVRDTTTSTSISVVGPTATFDLGSTVCGGQAVTAFNTTGDVNFTASISLPKGAPCKSYSSFTDSIVSGQGPTVSFTGFSTTQVQVTEVISWPLVPECQPSSDPLSAGNPHGIPPDLALPVCAPHHVSFNGVDFFDQTYCQVGNPSPPVGEPQAGLCTANKQYNNDSVSIDPNTHVVTTTPLTINGAPATQIVETWVGNVDWFHW